MNIYTFLLDLFTLTEPAYALCEVGEIKHKSYTDTKIDLWKLLILLQRFLILVYKILKHIKI